MLKEIHLAGSVRRPFGRFCAAFADVSAVELGKAAVERSGVKPEDVKELLVGNIFSGALRPNAPHQIGTGQGFVDRGMGIAMAHELT